jgi:hypothetical protein
VQTTIGRALYVRFSLIVDMFLRQIAGGQLMAAQDVVQIGFELWVNRFRLNRGIFECLAFQRPSAAWH